MRVLEVTGRLGVGGEPIELAPGHGLVALVGDGRARQAAQALVLSSVVGTSGHRRGLVRDARVLVEADNEVLELGPGGRAGAGTARRRLLEVVDLNARDLALAWAGGLDRDVTATVTRGARLLASRAGLDRVGRVLDAIAELPGLDDTLRHRDESDGELWTSARARVARLTRAERELTVLRADAAEVQGDLEEATMEWLRERQDAETQLMAFRDRARELKVRLRQMETSGRGTECPTCGKELDDHFDAVAAHLREEWEDVVQDGQWLKRRREQLELKPERLRDLESRSLRYQAAMEDTAERTERLRAALGAADPDANDLPTDAPEPVSRELDRLVAELSDPVQAADALSGLASQLLDDARTRLLSETSKILNRVSGGRLVGMEGPEGSRGALIPRPLAGAPGSEDTAVAQFAAHLALARLLLSDGLPLASLLVGEPFAAMEKEDQIRALAVLRRQTRRFPQILVLPAEGIVEAAPEAFDAVWEFRPAPEAGFPALRPLPAGVGSVSL